MYRSQIWNETSSLKACTPEEFIYLGCALKDLKNLIETIIIYLYFGGFIKYFSKST